MVDHTVVYNLTHTAVGASAASESHTRQALPAVKWLLFIAQSHRSVRTVSETHLELGAQAYSATT